MIWKGAAIYDKRLYLTTSQSDSTDGKQLRRSLFLRVDLEGNVEQATGRLRESIRDLFRRGLPDTGQPIAEWVNEGGKLEVMQVEGLAIDGKGVAYFGFRAPLVARRALVLRAPVDDIFKEAPKFEAFLLDLELNGEFYGIVSMDYDAVSQEMLILGNSPETNRGLEPAVWSWKIGKPGELQHPVAYAGQLFSPRLVSPGSRPAKPEVILLPRNDHVHLFFDAEGTGGQVGFTRTGTELLRVH